MQGTPDVDALLLEYLKGKLAAAQSARSEQVLAPPPPVEEPMTAPADSEMDELAMLLAEPAAPAKPGVAVEIGVKPEDEEDEEETE